MSLRKLRCTYEIITLLYSYVKAIEALEKRVSSLVTLNYFIPFLSVPIVDFEQVNTCKENYLTFYLLETCLNVSTGGKEESA